MGKIRYPDNKHKNKDLSHFEYYSYGNVNNYDIPKKNKISRKKKRVRMFDEMTSKSSIQ